MLGRQFLLGGAALAALGWRMADPKGSYAALYDTSHYLTDLVAGYDVLARFISLVLVDQFNGLMLGIALSTLLYLCLGGLRSLARWPFQKRRPELPLERYAVPGRLARVGQRTVRPA